MEKFGKRVIEILHSSRSIVLSYYCIIAILFYLKLSILRQYPLEFKLTVLYVLL